MSNRNAFSFASHSLDSSSLVLKEDSACARSSSDMLLWMGGEGEIGVSRKRNRESFGGSVRERLWTCVLMATG
jgi:hypothetical protein